MIQIIKKIFFSTIFIFNSGMTYEKIDSTNQVSSIQNEKIRHTHLNKRSGTSDEIAFMVDAHGFFFKWSSSAFQFIFSFS